MVEFSKLQRRYVSRAVFKPYAEVKIFPTVKNDKGVREAIDETWRGVEFTCLTPNTALIEKIENLESEVSIIAGVIAKPKVHAKDAMRYVCDIIIKGWNMEEDGAEIKYDSDWLYKHFFHVPWLYRTFISDYKKDIGFIPLASEKDGEDEAERFLYEQDNTVIIASKDTKPKTKTEKES